MRRMVFVLMAFMAFSGIALAHNGVEHMKGTVSQLTDKAITIDMPGMKPMTIALTADTTFAKSGKAAAAKDLKVGDRVVVDVVKKGNEMVAKAVKFGAATAPEPAAHQHKSDQ
jgi:hypothetical protein